MSQNLTFRLGMAWAVLPLCGALGLAPSPAQAAFTAKQLAAHQRYLACKARLQRDPPCTQSWTRYCARQCRAIFW